MESGETPHEQSETLWLPRHTQEVPKELCNKQVIAISFPETPEECRAAWARSSESTGEGGVGWVGTFTAEYTDRQGYVVFVASGSSENPDTGSALAFSDSEWEAFVGGVRLSEFNRPAELRQLKPRRPRSSSVIALLVLVAAGPMFRRNGSDNTAV